MNIRDAYPARGNPLIYVWRTHLLRMLCDLDRIKKDLAAGRRIGRILDSPWGTRVEDVRPCSQCKQLTEFTTPRGRYVHPACEGWIDTLTDAAMSDVFWHAYTALSAISSEESPCLFAPAYTLGAPDQTGSPTSQAT